MNRFLWVIADRWRTEFVTKPCSILTNIVVSATLKAKDLIVTVCLGVVHIFIFQIRVAAQNSITYVVPRQIS